MNVFVNFMPNYPMGGNGFMVLPLEMGRLVIINAYVRPWTKWDGQQFKQTCRQVSHSMCKCTDIANANKPCEIS